MRADRRRVCADYRITGVAIVLLVLQAVFLLPVLLCLDVEVVAEPVLLALNAAGFGALWVLRERARRGVGRLDASYGDRERDGVTPSLVEVYGQDVCECRRLWDAARGRAPG